MKKGVSAGGVAGDPSLSQSSPPPSQGSRGGRPLLPHEACAAMVSVWLLQEAQGEGGLWEGQGLKQGLSAHHEWDQHSPPWPRRNPALPTMAPDPERWRTVLSWTSQAQLPMLGPITVSSFSVSKETASGCVTGATTHNSVDPELHGTPGIWSYLSQSPFREPPAQDSAGSSCPGYRVDCRSTRGWVP